MQFKSAQHSWTCVIFYPNKRAHHLLQRFANKVLLSARCFVFTTRARRAPPWYAITTDPLLGARSAGTILSLTVLLTAGPHANPPEDARPVHGAELCGRRAGEAPQRVPGEVPRALESSEEHHYLDEFISSQVGPTDPTVPGTVQYCTG